LRNFNSDKEIKNYIEKTIKNISNIDECRLYREEQLQCTENVFRARNSTEWIIRINKVIEDFKYAIMQAYQYAKIMKSPLEETINSKRYAFYLEDAVYRDIVLWEMLRQFLNEFYECGYDTDNEINIFNFLKDANVKSKIGNQNIKKLKNYLYCNSHHMVRHGLNKSGGIVDALDDAEYSGSVISLIENGEAFIKRNCKMKWRKTANSREEMPEYVERSYHEALVNALAHRDYLVNGSEVHIDIYNDRMEIYSPGGMPDGSMIQDRDPLTVPSTRRNPVLADVFNRLGYMERKGSGFGKIISGYEFQINYNESKKPSFRSDRYQFTVVMPNLNYDVPQDVPRDVPQDVPQDKLDMQILDLISKDNKISTEKMAIALGVSSKTIKRHIKEMDNICYVGRGFSGHWEITDKE